MFKPLGILVAAYVLYAAWRGEVFARSGIWGKMVAREESPRYFWGVIGCYALLAIALLTVF